MSTNLRKPIVGLGAVVAVCIAMAGSASAQTEDRVPLATAIEEATDPSPVEGCCAGDTGNESFRWGSALIQVVGFNTAQHLFRLREPKTRNELEVRS